MSFSVFLTYSVEPGEQPLVWRLQTLATAQSISMHVPARETSKHDGTLRQEVRAAIDRADCVLAIITTRAGTEVQADLNYALKSSKLIVPIVQQDVSNANYFDRFPRVFWFSHSDPPSKIEDEVLDFLKTQELDKERKTSPRSGRGDRNGNVRPLYPLQQKLAACLTSDK